MKKSDLICILDPDEFRRALAKGIMSGRVSEQDAARIIHARSRWLWQTYKPADMDWHRKIYGRKRG